MKIQRRQGVFSSHTRLDVGNGSWTQLRRDLWFGDRALRETVWYYRSIGGFSD